MSDFLFDHTIQLNKKIMKSNSLFLFLDYDGTLVKFKKRPAEVRTSKKINHLIRQLIKNPMIQVIIVTGRPLHEIKKLLKIKGISFIALHGLHIENKNELKFSWKQADQALTLIKTIKENMREKLKDEKDVFLEDKQLTIGLHYRLLPIDKIFMIRKKFITEVQTIDKKKVLEFINGVKVIEARPKGWNKGKAIEMFLANYAKKKNPLSIYIGDDITDEDAFKFLRKRGITIFVMNKSKRKTTAQYWVKNPDDVFSFLESLHQLLNQ